MSITSGGVGIGVTNPGAKLYVNSTSSSSFVFGASSPAETYATSSSAKSQYFTAGTIISLTNPPDYVANAGCIIDYGPFGADGNTNVYAGGVAGGVGGGPASFVIGRRTGVTSFAESMRVHTNGYVGIGLTTPSYALHVSGAIYASGDITALSDQRHKQNITPLTDSLAAITQLSGYSYTRSDYKPGEKQIGLIAQEVKEVYPEAVSYDDVNDTYSLNYGCLMAPVIQAIKEMKDRIERQDLVIQQLLDSLGPQ